MLLTQFSAKLTIKSKNMLIISFCRRKMGPSKVRGLEPNGLVGSPSRRACPYRHISKICPYFESLHLGKYYCPYFLEMSIFLACALILSYLDFINKSNLDVICLALVFVLPSKPYCDIINATQSYLEQEEARHR